MDLILGATNFGPTDNVRDWSQSLSSCRRTIERARLINKLGWLVFFCFWCCCCCFFCKCIILHIHSTTAIHACRIETCPGGTRSSFKWATGGQLEMNRAPAPLTSVPIQTTIAPLQTITNKNQQQQHWSKGEEFANRWAEVFCAIVWLQPIRNGIKVKHIISFTCLLFSLDNNTRHSKPLYYI